MTALEALVKAYSKYSHNKELRAIGKSLSDIVTSTGFPEELLLEEFNRRFEHMALLERVFVLSEYRINLLEHMRQNTFTDKKLAKFRKGSVAIIASLL